MSRKSFAFVAVALLLAALAAACSDEGSPPSSTATPPAAAATTATPTQESGACEGKVPVTQSVSGVVAVLSYEGTEATIAPPIGFGWVDPVLSPDGSNLAYYGTHPAFGLYVATADGRNPRRVADVTQRHDQSPPVWSPRGDALAFESARGSEIDAPADIYVVGADGGGFRNLTRGAVAATGPTWSADGLRLAFSGSAPGSVNSDVYVANADGSGLRKVTDIPLTAFAIAASWSPDGNLIAFVTNRDGNAEVYAVRPDGSGQTNLTRNPAGDFASPIGSAPLTWSPDSKKVAFLSDRDGNLNVYAAHADGSSPTRLTSTPADETGPRWSPDGRCLLYYTPNPTPAGGLDLMLAPADNSTPVRLITVR